MVVAALVFSGCSDSVKSVEEYEKLSKEELDSMFKECEAPLHILPTNPDNVKILKELDTITEKIYEARGEKFPTIAQGMWGIGFYGQISDDELAKFGNSKYAKYVQCGRIALAREGGFENYVKNRSIAEKYKNLWKK